MTVAWKESYRIGQSAVDQQHQELFQSLQRFEELSSAQELETMFAFLLHYLERHFADEERFMGDIDFYEFEAHRERHFEFQLRLQRLSEGAVSEENWQEVALQLQREVTTWLIEHILEWDLRIGEYYRELHSNDRTFDLPQQATLLLCDSDRSSRRRVRQVLLPYQYRIDEAIDLGHAFRSASEIRYDVIFLHCPLSQVGAQGAARGMAHFSDFRRRLRQLRPTEGETPLIFLSSEEGVVGCEQALKLGADDCLVKPLAGLEVKSCLQRWLR
ncbi:MAG: response regulator [Gammaproteobacteria bacterium]|nr:response regulator [Gammaproteobacteria bacterium]